MDYGYKITKRGAALLATCLDLGMPLKLTRAAVGSGQVGEGVHLAGVHALLQYVADAAIVDRRHDGDRLFLTVQYASQEHPAQEDFILREIMVYAQDPETGAEVGFLYAGLGKYSQPVPAYRPGLPPGVCSFPMLVEVSGELEVHITASPGLVTSLDLQDAIDRLKLEIMTNELTLPPETDTGEQLLTDKGTPVLAVYRPNQSAGIFTALEALDRRLSGQIGQAAASCAAQTDSAKQYAVTAAQAYTDGRIAALQRQMETDAGSVARQIAAAKQEAIDAASADAAAKVSAHNDRAASHPDFLRVAENTPLETLPPGYNPIT